MGILLEMTTLLTIGALTFAQNIKYPLPKKYNPAYQQPVQPQFIPAPTAAYLVDASIPLPTNADTQGVALPSYLPLASYGAQEDQGSSYLPLPLVQQLPRVEGPQVPFYSPEPSTELKAPENYEGGQANNFFQSIGLPPSFQIPVPSQDLQVPIQLKWNPDNDPKYLYDVSSPAKQEIPTDTRPKKYNKDLHATSKPRTAKYQSENPSDVDDAVEPQRLKKLHRLAKQENQKRVQAEKQA